MQVIVYHSPNAFDRSYLTNDSKSILIDSESLTKVALIDTNWVWSKPVGRGGAGEPPLIFS